MATITSITITVSTSELITKIRRNLAIIGKRARRNNGDSMYSDLTASTLEEPLYDDLLMFGAQNIVSCLCELCTAYVENDSFESRVDGSISFTLVSPRLNTNDSVITLLKSLITDYLYNFVLSRYLSDIHPSTGDKYPPLWGKNYSDVCSVLMENIKSTAFMKRPLVGGTHNYGDLGVDNYVADDGVVFVNKPRSESFTYTGSVITFATTNDDYTVSGNTNGTNIGSYSVTYTLKEGRKWMDGTNNAITVVMSIVDAFRVYYGSSLSDEGIVPENGEYRLLPVSGTLDITTVGGDHKKCHWVAVDSSSGYHVTKVVDSEGDVITSAVSTTTSGRYTIYRYKRPVYINNTTKFTISL